MYVFVHTYSAHKCTLLTHATYQRERKRLVRTYVRGKKDEYEQEESQYELRRNGRINDMNGG